MIRPLVVLTMSWSFGQGGGGTSHDSWFGADKVKHFFVGTFTQSIAYGGIRLTGGSNAAALGGASLVTVGAGVAKEFRDRSEGGTASIRDVVWTVGGGAAASVVLSHTRRIGRAGRPFVRTFPT